MANLRVNKITGTEVFETTGSVQFDGSGDYLSLASSSDFAMGTGDFTVEFWTYPTARTTYEPYFIVGATGGLWIGKYQNNFVLRAFNVSDFIQVSTLPELNTWTHIAVTRFNSVAKIFYNGIEVGSSSNTYEFIQSSARIANDTSSNYVTGHISNLRVIKGKALYTTNFTPPTRELTVTPETVLLCCQSTTNTAQEATGKTITVNGNAVANELTPGLLTDVVKSGGSSAITGSVEFDGTGDYLALSSSDFAFGTGDFTLEFWFYDTSPTSGIRRWVTSTLGAFGASTFIIRETDGDITYHGGISTLSYPKNNSWSHIAYTRSNGMEYVFYNGVLLGSASSGMNYTDTTLYIGGYYNANNTEYTQGFISNFRIVKGTALYTDNFIPPTRELKKVPGTVLLCCQDSNDPTQEATGKTITPYGSLDRTDLGVELVTNGTFDTDLSGWTLSADTPPTWASGGYLQLNSDGLTYSYADQSITTKIGSTYKLSFTQIANANQLYVRVGTSQGSSNLVNQLLNPPVDGVTYSYIFTATTTTTWIQFSDGSSGANQQIDNVSVTKLDPGTKPAFTPPVGFDGSVTFEGTTKINTENYFYLPTGNTESRGRGRGVFGGGGSPAAVNTIEYIQIQSTGNGIDFGDLTTSVRIGASCASQTRGLFVGGFSDPATKSTAIQYITLASTGNSLTFGSLSDGTYHNSGVSNSTRGVIAGGLNSTPYSDGIVFVTIASTGNAQTFGTLSEGRRMGAPNGVSSPTRGIWAGGQNPSPGSVNIMEYITISSTGNAQTFGELNSSVGRYGIGSCSNSIRGVFGGGYEPTANINTIEYITIPSLGNAQDFGDLTQSKRYVAAVASQTRGVFGGGGPTNVNNIEYVTIASTGNGLDFGDLTQARKTLGSCSDSHGGLG